MKIKTWTALLLTLALLSPVLTACGKEETPPVADTGSGTVSETVSPAAPGTEEPEPIETEPAQTEKITEAVTEKQTEKIKEETTAEKVPEEPDILSLKKLKVGGKDYAGYEVKIIDEDEGLYVTEIVGKVSGWNLTYRGYAMIIDDPARLIVSNVPESAKYGYSVKKQMSTHGGIIAGINASGFNDPGESGGGNDLVGASMAEGKMRGTVEPYYHSLIMTKDNRFVVGKINDWTKANARDAMQFGPVLINDGKAVNDQTGGFIPGTHPRTAIGQRADGVIVLLVIDGRVEGSAGCGMEELIEIFTAYNCVTAGCCDGGSSCVLAYNDKVINKNSAEKPEEGRLIPNAWLVKSKSAK
ncbi:MAG: phosphodiester glycosidase family protein [Clostridia bacterium]|nr:phosphodiester glycosidase family protein [Clostridia bacterium]